jgi:hypothetical protein
LLRNAAGVGVKTRLQEAQRQSWTISIFLRRVPFRVIAVLPQWGQRSGRFSVYGTRADRGILPGIRDGFRQRTITGAAALATHHGGQLAIPYLNRLRRMGSRAYPMSRKLDDGVADFGR